MKYTIALALVAASAALSNPLASIATAATALVLVSV